MRRVFNGLTFLLFFLQYPTYECNGSSVFFLHLTGRWNVACSFKVMAIGYMSMKGQLLRNSHLYDHIRRYIAHLIYYDTSFLFWPHWCLFMILMESYSGLTLQKKPAF